MKATLHFDGGARPTNPGFAGFAAILKSEHKPAFICARFIGWKTNNYAEYAGLLVGVKMAVLKKVTHLDIITDSQLVVGQMTGKWKCKSTDLRPIMNDAKDLLSQNFGELDENWTIVWKKRDNNVQADDLCTKAINAGRNRNPFTPDHIKEKRPGEVFDPFTDHPFQ